jgi:hypothetical protein
MHLWIQGMVWFRPTSLLVPSQVKYVHIAEMSNICLESWFIENHLLLAWGISLLCCLNGLLVSWDFLKGCFLNSNNNFISSDFMDFGTLIFQQFMFELYCFQKTIQISKGRVSCNETTWEIHWWVTVCCITSFLIIDWIYQSHSHSESDPFIILIQLDSKLCHVSNQALIWFVSCS